MDWSQFLTHLQFLYQCTNNITAKYDSSTKSAVEIWKAQDENDLLMIKTIILQQSMNNLEYFSLIIQSSDALRQEFFQNHLLLKEYLVHFLLYWMNLPQYEVLFLLVQNILTFVIQYYISVLNQLPVAYQPTSDHEKTMVANMNSIYVFLTNAFLNRLNHSSAYLYDTTSDSSESTNKKQKENNYHRASSSKLRVRTELKKQQSTEDVMSSLKNTELKSYNLLKHSLLLQDLLVNLLIDFNSSDHYFLHEWYGALKTSEKLKLIEETMKKNYSELFQKTKKLRQYLDQKEDEEVEGNGTEDDEGMVNSMKILLLKNEETEKIEESLMNVENFILYKRNFGK
jgi:hypothetical protein